MIKAFHVSYILRTDKIDAKGLTPIYLRITVDGQKTEISMQRRIEPIYWNKRAMEPRPINQELQQLCIYLDSQKNAVYEIHSQLSIARQTITLQKIKDKLLGTDETQLTLLELARKHNKEFESLIGSKYSYGSYKNYKTTLRYLSEFVWKAYKRRDLILGELDYQFAEKYYKFLMTDRPCTQNGAVKHIQRLKKLMNYAVRLEILPKNPFNAFQVGFKPYYRQILNWDDLITLSSTGMPNEALSRTRDIFLFQCYTGLAYVDIKHLKRENIIKGPNGKLWVVITRQKTHIKSSIPLLPEALLIAEKYFLRDENLLFPVISNQKMNKNLKAIAQYLGLSVNLSSHAARHTFATTVTLSNDVPIETVSKMLGHTNLRTTQIYAKVLDTKISRDMDRLIELLSSKS